MNAPTSNRVQSLWHLLLALFGIDAVGRKFGQVAPAAWADLLASMNDFQFARGLKRLPLVGKPHVPSLPEFLRLCRDTGGVGDIDEPYVPAARQVEGPKLRPWQMVGNRHLLSYIRAMTPGRPRRYIGDGPTGCLVAMKNAWVADMEADDAAGKLPGDGGKAGWEDCMGRAEAMIDRGQWIFDGAGRSLTGNAA